MALETGTYIDDLVSTNPVSSTDLVRYGAGHIQLLKTTIKNSFAGAGGVVLVAASDSSATANTITLSPTPAITEYTTRMLVVWHQAVTNTGATTMNISALGSKSVVSVANAALASGDLVAGRAYVGEYDGTSIQLIAVTKNYVDQLAFNTVLPAQAGNSGKVLTTNGTTAAWGYAALTRSARTSNTILGIADGGTFVDITSGTFSQTFTAAATLGAGWWLFLRNSGTGDITLDPNGAETIDGLTTFIMYPGECRLIQSDASNLNSFVISGYDRKFTSTGTYTKPPGYQEHICDIMAGGGGGGSGRRGAASTRRDGGGSGGGGAFVQRAILSSSIGTTETVTIGAGGAAGTAQTTNSTDGVDGGNGGNSSFGSLAIAYGGGGGNAGNTSGNPAGGGGGLLGAANLSTAGAGASGFGGAGGANGAAAGTSGYGGGGGSCTSGAASFNGGCSSFGGAGGGHGGSITNADAFITSADGGSRTGTSGGGGAGGTNGGSPTAGAGGTTDAFGGGGGGASITVAAAAGGVGGLGGGGGGGGASLNGSNSGAGGVGGAGYVRIRGFI